MMTRHTLTTPDKQKPQQIIKSITVRCLIESLNVKGFRPFNSQFQPL